MKLFVYVLFLCTVVLGREAKTLDGGKRTVRNLVRKKRILKGEVVNEVVPYMVSVQRRWDRAHVCGGTLVYLRLVVTSCSCVAHSDDSASGLEPALPKGYIVIAGSKSNWNLNDANTRIAVRMEADARCRYDLGSELWEHDIGYITVQKPFNFIENNLETIKNFPTTQWKLDADLATFMYKTDFQEGGKEYCYVYGWGASATKKEDGVFDVDDITADLKHKAVQFVNKSDCRARLCSVNRGGCAFDLDKSKAFCIASSGGAKGPLCFGDNGSPLICGGRFFAVGEVTFECGFYQFSLFFKIDVETIRTYLSDHTSFPKISHFLFPFLTVFLSLQFRV
ncbi:uncharacterized protein LOC112126180 [Cimex lectularius]|uniref:Peptidase S1 domain-containing protein n=1 Tax=Cimex lectularius TaxID=79782 RepID=A0A8I6SEC6_CIMLE|nr:uncharacterized protein LOC112126180 [Cimex lectularius]